MQDNNIIVRLTSPPEWMSTVFPNMVEAIALHSMCQPKSTLGTWLKSLQFMTGVNCKYPLGFHFQTSDTLTRVNQFFYTYQVVRNQRQCSNQALQASISSIEQSRLDCACRAQAHLSSRLPEKCVRSDHSQNFYTWMVNLPRHLDEVFYFRLTMARACHKSGGCLAGWRGQVTGQTCLCWSTRIHSIDNLKLD